MFRILYPEPVEIRTQEPDCFRDLNLDAFLKPVFAKENRLDLSQVFYTPLQSVEQIRYRQEIQKDLLKKDNLRIFDSFSEEICSLADREAEAGRDLRSGDPWRCNLLLYGHILDYGERYCRCMENLARKLPDMDLTSRGLKEIAEDLQSLREAPFYQSMTGRQQELRRQMNGVHYVMQIRYGTVRVKKQEGEENLAEKIQSVFGKFHQEDSRDYRQNLKEEPYADHVEAAVLQCLSKLYPREFETLTAYVKEFSHFTDPDLLQFCREIRFYIDWLQAIRPMEEWGLPFCFPEFRDSRFFIRDFFDLVLGNRIGSAVVKNELSLDPEEQILVITGPNQGGKTTFARALGQIHYLAGLGLRIPGSAAGLRLTDRVLTHFEREESQDSGRLQEELVRLQQLLSQATPRSLLIINEIFASTSAKDALALGKQMLKEISRKGSMTVLVTFLTELADCIPGTVSMMSTVDPENPAVRTFRILRRPPDGRTYAMTLAENHGLTYEQILRRIGL